jgi:hypothetical protein
MPDFIPWFEARRGLIMAAAAMLASICQRYDFMLSPSC